MSKMKMVLVLATLAFSVNSLAAPLSKVQAEMKLNTENKSEVKTAERFKAEFEKLNGDLKKMSPELKDQFNKAMAVFSAKAGVKTNTVSRLVLRKGPEVLTQINRLESLVKEGDAQQQKAARTQLELMDTVGDALDSKNYNTVQGRALVNLATIDLASMPTKATEIAEKLTKDIRNGKDLVKSTDEDTKGLKMSSLEDLANCK
jgi:hypothetical protein